MNEIKRKEKAFKFDAKLASLAFFIWVIFIALSTDLQHLGWSEWLENWFRWDANWYERIWTHGYAVDLRLLVFPPLFSWLTGALSWVTAQPFSTTALLINLPSYFAFAWLSSRTLSKKFEVDRAALFAFALASPVGFYAFTAYSDAVFALVFWILLPIAWKEPSELKRSEKLLAWGLTLAAPFLRLNGYAFAVWLPFRRWFAVMPLVALGIWLTFNWRISGDPWFFLEAQQLFDMDRGNVLDGMRFHLSEFINPPFVRNDEERWHWLQTTVLPLTSTALLLLTCVWLCFRRQWLIAATVLSVMVVSRNQPFWRSVFRYDLPLMPFVALPWLSYFEERLNKVRKESAPSFWGFDWRRTLAIVIGALFFVLLFGGLVLQFVFARKLHSGGWTF